MMHQPKRLFKELRSYLKTVGAPKKAKFKCVKA